MNLAHRKWLSAILFAVSVLPPASASAGMTPGEVKVFEGYKAKAEKGDADAQFNLGYFYSRGKGVVKDEVEAVKWYRKAADRGDASGQVFLGNCYVDGRGVKKDGVEAVKWYRKAAEQGNAFAQTNLGLCYANGTGVAKDEIEAYAYYNFAGITDEDARNNLTLLENKMSRDEVAAAQKRTKELQKEIEAKIAAKKGGK